MGLWHRLLVATLAATDRPSAPAQQRDGVPDRPTLSATGHGSRPDSGDPTDRLSRAVSPPPGWVGPADRPTLSEAARAREVYFQLRFALCGVCVRVWGGGGALPPEGGIHLSLPYTSHPSPLGRLAILSIAFLPALAMCTTWNSCLSPASLLLLGALFFVT